ncbi:MAG: 16S rRNA (cytosine(1402)-N(4))-methyltransferase RsmH [Chloroflexota bacterium]|nr:16S rRNA (cytosine(1402)-N(4))-methyltransferase RsmH [Chloroflexota bacterium]MDE2948692.1 16S rRNA (cytosine(1402)-N(4))-methyltransferase RsmH [Chloroflexota bacterium]
MNQHIAIMEREIVEALRAADPAVKRLIDGTVGGGGHTLALLRAGIDEALGMDLDESAIAQANARLAEFGERVSLAHRSYTTMADAASALGWQAVDAILLDLGLSSLQLDDKARGFSFRFDAPLDMRFDRDQGETTAQDLVNNLPAADLAGLLFRYGEERQARRIAGAIVERRPIQTTRQLAELVARVKARPARGSARIHPATRVFQALRIAVNGELDALERVLPIAVDLLRQGGRLAVISFHSLEDRIVKQSFKALSTSRVAPPGMASIGQRVARVSLVNRKPISPTEEEVKANPRSRSAKLRVVEKLEWA